MRIVPITMLSCIVFVSIARSQETTSPPDITELLLRLEQAESRIHQLEAQLDGKKTSTAPIESISAEEPAPAEPLVKRLETLESEYKADKEAAAKSKDKKPSLKIGGRIHMDYWGHPQSDPGINVLERGDPTLTPQERFTFRRLRIFAEGNVSDTMVYKFETEFGNPNDFEIRDAFIGFTDLPVLQTVLVGNQKRPLGLDTWNSSRYTVFMERPMVVDAFNEDARRVGVMSYGNTESEALNWQYGVFLLEKVQDDGDYRDDHLQLSFNGRLSGTPWYDESSGGRGYLHLALATMVAHTDGDSRNMGTTVNQGRFFARPSARTASRWFDTGRIDQSEYYEVLALEALLNVGAFSLTSEYQATMLQRDEGLDDLLFHGGYVQLAYWLTGEHTPIERKKGALDRTRPYEDFFLVNRCLGGTGGGWGALQLAWRAQYLDLSDSDILGGEGYSTAVGFNWWWNSNARLQFNYLIGRITDHAQVGGNSAGGDYNILGWRMMVDF